MHASKNLLNRKRLSCVTSTLYYFGIFGELSESNTRKVVNLKININQD